MGDLIIKVRQGSLQGRECTDHFGGKYYSFQGIPYAKPPIGKLRFKAPEPPENWDGVRDATYERDECFAHHMVFRHVIGSEDCLFLNVYTPKLPKSSQKLRPVMVWIHGGSFTTGSSKTEVYGPDFLISQDVVIVTINYRLGILGFLSLEDSSLNVPGNAAFKDMVMALKWVQNNIISFNGDPNNVTIFGESAGGAAVHFLMLSPMAKGLFHKVIAQSGCALNIWAKGQRCAGVVAEKLGFKSSDEAEILNFLQKVPVEKILEAQDSISDSISADKIRPHGPVVEKPHSGESFLPQTPLEIILSGNYSKVPLMTGYTNREGIFFDIVSKRTGTSRFTKDFETLIPYYVNIPKGSELSLLIAKKIKDFYFDGQDPSKENLDIDNAMKTDIFFWRGIYKTIINQKDTSYAPVYLYRMTVETELGFYKRLAETDAKGVCHADDLGYLWKTVVTPSIIKPGSTEDKTIQRMIKLWANFAKRGDPNPVEKDSLIPVKWLPVRKGEINFLDIGEELLTGVDPDGDRMAFWDEIHQSLPHVSKL